MTTRRQADVGLGAAIAYFAAQGKTVSIPLTESQRYDLVIDDGRLNRIEVKTSTFKRRSKYVVLLKTCGGNRSGTGKTTLFDPDTVDYLFIWTPEGSFCIPSAEVGARNALTLGKRIEPYRI